MGAGNGGGRERHGGPLTARVPSGTPCGGREPDLPALGRRKIDERRAREPRPVQVVGCRRSPAPLDPPGRRVGRSRRCRGPPGTRADPAHPDRVRAADLPGRSLSSSSSRSPTQGRGTRRSTAPAGPAARTRSTPGYLLVVPPSGAETRIDCVSEPRGTLLASQGDGFFPGRRRSSPPAAPCGRSRGCRRRRHGPAPCSSPRTSVSTSETRPGGPPHARGPA